MKTCENCGWRGKWVEKFNRDGSIYFRATCRSPFPSSCVSKFDLIKEDDEIMPDSSTCPCWTVRGEHKHKHEDTVNKK